METLTGKRVRLPIAPPPEQPPRDGKARPARPAPDPTDGAEAFQQVADSLRMRKGLIVGMAVLGGVLAAVTGLLLPPSYLATAQLIVELRPPDAADFRFAGLTGGSATVPQAVEESAIETHVTVLLSDGHLRRTLEALRSPGNAAEEAEDSSGGSHPASLSRPIRTYIRGAWSSAGRLLRGTPSEADEAASPAAAESAAIRRLRHGLKASQERRSRVITIGYMAPDPRRAAETANTVARLYVEYLTRIQREQAERALSWFAHRLSDIEREVARAENAVQSFRLAHGTLEGSVPDETGQQIAQAARQLALARSGAAAAQQRLGRFETLRSRGASTAMLADAAGSGRLAELAERESDQDRADATSEERDDLRRAIVHEIGVAASRLEADSRTAEAQVRSIESRLKLLQEAASGAAGDLATLRALERQAAALAQLYEALLRRRQEIAEQIELAQPEVRLLATAWPPERPASLHPALLIPPAMIAFALLGGLLAVGFGRLDRTIHAQAEAADILGVPCAGLVPELSRWPVRRLPDLLRRPDGAYATAIRSVLAATTSLGAATRMQKVVLVTSSIPGEGKTTLAWSLALCASRLQWRVLLLDFDRSSASPASKLIASHKFVAPEAHLSDVLARKRPLADAIGRIPELAIEYLPAPEADGGLLHFFASPQAPFLRQQMRETYDLVIIDGPAALEGPEAKLIAGWADDVLFALRWGSTRRDTARHALRLLEAAECRDPAVATRIASVLTRVDLKRHVGYRFGDGSDLLLSRTA